MSTAQSPKDFINFHTDYTTVRRSMFLGETMGLIENLRNEFPLVWDQYKQLKSLDWDETEINIDSCKNEFRTLPTEITELLINTLAFQFEADSSASHIGRLMYPFVTNTELTAYLIELSKNECLTPDHEVLTPDGWVRIDQITTEHKVAQWDYETREVSFVQPTQVFEKDYKGKMLHFTDTAGKVDQLVTPNHRMPILNPYGDSGEKQWEFAEHIKYDEGNAIPTAWYSTNTQGGYEIHFTDRDYVVGNSVVKTEVEYDGKVHCLTVPSSYFLVRRNNAVSVTGNCLHALAYKFIVESSFDNPALFIERVMGIQESFQRLDTVKKVFTEIFHLGNQYNSGVPLDEKVVRKAILKFWAALLCLERIQFISSFAITFGLAENGYFVPIAKLVQKIATDEFQVHVQSDKIILKNELAIPEIFSLYLEILPEIEEIIQEVEASELSWLKGFLFKDKSVIAGIQCEKIEQFVIYSASEVYDFFGLTSPHGKVTENPLPYMNKWLVIDNNQPSPQEENVGNYLLGRFTDDSKQVDMSRYQIAAV